MYILGLQQQCYILNIKGHRLPKAPHYFRENGGEIMPPYIPLTFQNTNNKKSLGVKFVARMLLVRH